MNWLERRKYWINNEDEIEEDKENMNKWIEKGIEATFSLPFLAFNHSTKLEIREKQNGICADCGAIPTVLEAHHIVPQHLGGSDNFENGVGLCPSCHQWWDEEADNGWFFPGITKSQTKPEQWGKRRNIHKST